jgi:hypothetical protein
MKAEAAQRADAWRAVERNGVGVRQEVPERVEAHAAVGEVDDIFGIHVVLESPAGPDSGNSGGGVNEDAVHVDEEALAQDLDRAYREFRPTSLVAR